MAPTSSRSATRRRKSPALYGTHGWPETYIIDRTGIVRRKFIGPVQWTSPEITDYLTKLASWIAHHVRCHRGTEGTSIKVLSLCLCASVPLW